MKSYSAMSMFAAVICLSGCDGNHDAELQAMVSRGVEKAKSEGMEFLQSNTVRVQIVVDKKIALVTFHDSDPETTYELYYIYDGRWKLTGGKTKSKDRVILDAVPLSLSKYFNP